MSERPERAAGVEDVSLDGRTVLVTGSTGGIGRETALSLGRLGATVLVHGRDRERGGSVVEELESAGADAAFHRADFASLAAVEDLAARVRESVGTLDVLVNNAAAIVREPDTTDDGIERTFAINHVAPYLLTRRLLPAMPDDGRVVTVASAAHERAQMNFEALRVPPDGYSAFDAYARSKLANVLFTRELARRLDGRGSGIATSSLHPGAVPTSGIVRNYARPIRAASRLAAAIPGAEGFLFDSVARAARTPVFLAAAPAAAAADGEYFVDCERATPSRAARDPRTARRLWRVSADLAGVDPELDLEG